MKANEILKKFPLRIALTDYCSLQCFFCSNEGMGLKWKNLRQIDFESLKYLLDVSKKSGLTNISLTGGEPSLYKDIDNLLSYIKELKLKQTFFHTNGVNLTPRMIDLYLRYFSKVAVSIHAVDFQTWHKLTRGTKMQFSKLMKNLEHLSCYAKTGQLLVEIKVVPLKGINDSLESYKQILDFCSDHNFKFKFLNFETITPDQIQYRVDHQKNLEAIQRAGAEKLPPDNVFRGQKSYLPLNWFKYKNVKGVVIEIGCGQAGVCESCATSNEIFIDPNLKIKPCHMSDFSIPLKPLIEKRQEQKILDAIVESRDFLSKRPGLGVNFWIN